MIGELLIGRYLVLKQLGVGGFSKTYLVRDKYLPNHPLCVVKCLHLDSTRSISIDSAQQLFQREAQILQELSRKHDRLPWLLAYSAEADPPCLVEEYIDGDNLETHLERSQLLTEAELIRLLQDMLQLLEFIHKRNVIHHDIKPSNLIRRRQDHRVALIDFGAAIRPGETPLPDMAFGTPGYLSIEQEQGHASFSSDLYSLGITAIQLLIGVHPQQLKKSPVSGELDWHSYLDPRSIDPRLVAILDKLVRVKASDRYARAADALSDLSSLSDSVAPSSSVASKSIRGLQNKAWWAAGITTAVSFLLVTTSIDETLMQQVPKVSEIMQQTLPKITDQVVAKTTPSRSETLLKLLHEVPINQEVQHMVMLPKQLLVTGKGANQIQLWNVQQGQVLKTWTSASKQLAFLTTSPDGKRLISVGHDRQVQIWDMPSGRLLSTFVGHPQSIESVAISADNRTLAVRGNNQTIQVWDLWTKGVVRTIVANAAYATPMIYVPANLLVHEATDHSLQFWRARRGELQFSLAGHTDAVMSFQLDPDRRFLYSFGKDRAMAWDLEKNELARTFGAESAQAISARIVKNRVLTLHEHGKLRQWDRSSGELIQTIGPVGDRAVLCPESRYLVSYTSDKRLKIWQLQIN